MYFQANAWAQSKHLPGQFTGSVDVRILSQQELAGPDRRNQAWARKVGVRGPLATVPGPLVHPVLSASRSAGQLVIRPFCTSLCLGSEVRDQRARRNVVKCSVRGGRQGGGGALGLSVLR